MPLDGATLGFMPKPDNSAFALAIANRIRLAREEAGYHSAAEFFRELGKEGWESHFRSQNTWHQYERGELLMSVPKLIRVAEVASVSLDWLLAGEESVPPPYLEWLESPMAKTASEQELDALRRMPLHGYTPSARFYDLALQAIRHGLEPAEAADAGKHAERLS